MRICLLAVATAAVLPFASAKAVDGIWTKSNGSASWSNTGFWLRGVVPDGGRATFLSCPEVMNIDCASVALDGLLVRGRTMTCTNTAHGIRLTGAPASLINENSTLTMRGPLAGTGANRLEIGGSGGMVFENLASDFGEVAVVDGPVALTAKAGTVLSHGTVSVGGGEIRVAPSLAAGETADLAMCDGAGSRFICGPGLGRLALDHGAGAGVTLAVPALDVRNGALLVYCASSLSALGEADRLLIAQPPAVENGMVTPALALYDDASTLAGAHRGTLFASYDAARGVVPAAAPVPWSDADDQRAAIVRLSAAATVAAPKSVWALYWDAADGRALTLNADLKILSGGLIVNVPSDETVTGMTIDGTGALDFGERQGVLRGPGMAATGHRSVDIAVKAPITGTQGIVFSGPAMPSRPCRGTCSYTLARPAAWTGPTVVACGARLVIGESLGAQAFPAGGDVYLMGGTCGGGSIRLTASTAFDQNFVIAGSGNGYPGDGNTGPFYIGGGNVTLTFNGATRFQDVVYFSHDNPRYVMRFNGKVTGAGCIAMNCGVLEFAGANDYRGEIAVTSAGGALAVSGDGTLGAARVVVEKGALTIRNANGQTLANDIASTGTLTIDGGRVALTGRVTSEKTILDNGAVVEIGDDVDLGAVTFRGGAKVMAAPGAMRARVEIGGDGLSDVDLSTGLSGASTAALVKTGTNTVAVNPTCAFGGDLTVAEGTLRLEPGLLCTSVFWLDASRPDTVTAADGKATAWRSRTGMLFTHETADGGVPGTYPGAKMNGLDTMRFDHAASSYTWFVAERFVDIRSIYICMRPQAPASGSISPWGWYGKGNPEYGLRWATWETWHDLGFAREKKRVNGGRTPIPATPDGVPLIIGQFNADDSAEPKTMRPSIGGYQTWGRTQNAYNGEIGEVIAFDHELSEDEKKAVEQYLSVKWGVYDAAGIWPEADGDMLEGGAVLAESAKVTLVADAVLDLNGATQTIAALAGAGLVTNSSPRAAVLTVTGPCDFTGVIAANVTLVASGTVRGEVDGELVVDGAALAFADGAYAPPDGGRLWWFDAAEVTDVSATAASAGSIQTNAHGRVLRWHAKGDAGTYFESTNLGGGAAQYARYVAAEEGVNPGLYLNASVGLCCNQANTPHTIAVMYEFDASFSAASYFFCGDGFGDAAMRFYSGQALEFDFNFRSKASFSNQGDVIYVNGARIVVDGATPVRLPQGAPCCFIGTRDPAHTDANWTNRRFCFGSSCWSKGLFGTKVCEAICYDRLLTDAECRALNAYLVNKWSGRRAPRAKLGPGAVLGVKGGGTLDLRAASPVRAAKLVSDAGGGALAGDLALDGFEYDARGAAAAAPLAVAGRLSIAEGAPFSAVNTANLPRRGWTLLSAEAADGRFRPAGLGAEHWLFRAGARFWGLAPCGLRILVR